jgi:hypothetical protein
MKQLNGLSSYIVAAVATRQGCVIREAPEAAYCCLRILITSCECPAPAVPASKHQLFLLFDSFSAYETNYVIVTADVLFLPYTDDQTKYPSNTTALVLRQMITRSQLKFSLWDLTIIRFNIIIIYNIIPYTALADIIIRQYMHTIKL